NQLAKIAQDGFDGLAVLGRGGGQPVDQRSRLNVRQNGKSAGIAQIVGDPVDGLMGGRAEFVGRHASPSLTAGHFTRARRLELRSFSWTAPAKRRSPERSRRL